MGNKFSDKQAKSFILEDALHRAENNLEARKGEVRVEGFGREKTMALTSVLWYIP